MADFQLRDFYFGACMFSFFKHNQDTTPSIIENMDDIEVIKMTTNTSDDFYIIMKYTKSGTTNVDGSISWTFPLSDKNRQMIEKYHSICDNVYIFFICGETSYSKAPNNIYEAYNLDKDKSNLYIEEIKSGQVAIYRYCDYIKVKDKKTLTIKHLMSKKRYEQSFSLILSKAGSACIKSRCNNIKKKITDIEIN